MYGTAELVVSLKKKDQSVRLCVEDGQAEKEEDQQEKRTKTIHSSS